MEVLLCQGKRPAGIPSGQRSEGPSPALSCPLLSAHLQLSALVPFSVCDAERAGGGWICCLQGLEPCAGPGQGVGTSYLTFRGSYGVGVWDSGEVTQTEPCRAAPQLSLKYPERFATLQSWSSPAWAGQGGLTVLLSPPGTRIIYDRKFLMECRNSPVAKTPPSHLPDIPGVTSPSVEELKLENHHVQSCEEKVSAGQCKPRQPGSCPAGS